jgi:hypothetical protein
MKKLLLTAALVAAGALPSMAQSNVYSLNIVGYVNVSVPASGYVLLSDPLVSADSTNGVNNTLTNQSPVIQNGFLFVWNAAGQKYQQLVAGGDGNWYDPGNGFAASTNSIPPGSSFFIQNVAGSATTITLVGSVLTGTNTVTVNSGYGFFGNFEPVAGDLTTNGFPINDNSLIFNWDVVNQKYDQWVGVGSAQAGNNGNPLILDPGNGFAPVTYVPAIGQGFVYLNPGVQGTEPQITATPAWTQVFTPQ